MADFVVIPVIVIVFGRRARCNATDGKATWKVIGACSGGRHAELVRGTAEWGSNGHGRGEGAVGSIEACLNEVLAFGLGDEGL